MSNVLAASVRPPLFPPPSVPLLFTDGDRYEWPHVGEVLTRINGWWVPSRYDDGRDAGSGWWSDADVRGALGRAVESWNVRQRFVPVRPTGPILPGRTLLALPPVHDAAQYVAVHQGVKELVPLRELVAQHDEDAAYDVPAVITGEEMRDVVISIVAEQEQARVTYDETAGRVYVRYQRPSDFGVWQGAGFPAAVRCLHVFVLAASPAEVA